MVYSLSFVKMFSLLIFTFLFAFPFQVAQANQTKFVTELTTIGEYAGTYTSRGKDKPAFVQFRSNGENGVFVTVGKKHTPIDSKTVTISDGKITFTLVNTRGRWFRWELNQNNNGELTGEISGKNFTNPVRLSPKK